MLVLKVVAFIIFVHCGFVSTRVTTTLYALEHNESAWTVGLLLSLFAVIPALISIHVGRWIDTVGARKPIYIGIPIIAVACLLPVLLPYEVAGIWPLYATCTLAGTGFLFLLITGQDLVGHLSTQKNRATSFTYLAMGFSASGILGPLVSGYLIEKISFSWAYLGALGFVCSGALFFCYVHRSLPLSWTTGKATRKPKQNPFALFAIPRVRNVLIASALVSMAWDLQSFMVPVYGKSIGLSAVEIGWLLSVFASCTFAVRVIMPALSRQFSEWQIIIFVLISAGLAFMAFPLFESLLALFILVGWLGSSLGASQPNVMSLLHQESPPGQVGEAIGVRTMLMNASHTILPLIFGAGGSLVGAGAAFWTLGSTMIGSGITIFRSNKKLQEQTEMVKSEKQST